MASAGDAAIGGLAGLAGPLGGAAGFALGGPVGGIIGSSLGSAIGGAFGGMSEAEARQVAFRRFREQQQMGIHRSVTQADEIGQSIAKSPLAMEAKRFLFDVYRGGNTQQANEFSQGLRVAQESRGLRRSTSGAVAEASSLAAFNANLRAQLLPQVESFATLAERVRNNRLQTDLPAQIGFYTGAPIPGISNQNALLGDPTAFNTTVQAQRGATAGFASGLSQGSSVFGGMGGGGGGGLGGMLGGGAAGAKMGAGGGGMFSIPKGAGAGGFTSGNLFAMT